MKKVLICLMISVYMFGNFSVAFADSRSHNRQFKQKYKSGSGAHKQNFRKGRGTASRANKPHAVQKRRSGPRFNKTQPRQNPRTGLRGQRPHVAQKHRNTPRVQKPHVVQKRRSGSRAQKPHIVRKHRSDRRVQRPRFSRNYRYNRRLHQSPFSRNYRRDRHLYRPRYSRNYRPYPRVHYGHRHSYGYRIHILPHGFISFSIGGLSYYYASGNYYRDYSGYYEVVQPPIGAVISVPPPGYRIIYIDSHQYYLSGGVYYVWDNVRRGYRVVSPPEVINETSEELPETLESSLNLFVYPKAGQGENERANDRHDCHLWAVGETDTDPTLDQSSTELERSDYKRAITACLEGREYTVE
jgi:hypothetical protein